MLSYVYFNNNPMGRSVGDCSVRAISCALDKTWDEIYMELTKEGFRQADMPSSNAVSATYLRKNGFNKYPLPDNEFYSVRDFADAHPINLYILATGNHFITVRDGDYYDAWDSGNEIPVAYWKRVR